MSSLAPWFSQTISFKNVGAFKALASLVASQFLELDLCIIQQLQEQNCYLWNCNVVTSLFCVGWI